MLLVQTLTKELVGELQDIRIRAALPSLTLFSRNKWEEMKQLKSQQQHSLDDDDEVTSATELPPLFPLQHEFMRLLPRRSILYKSSSYHHCDEAVESLQQHDDVGRMTTFVSHSSANIPANIFIHPSPSSSHASRAHPSQASPHSQLFFKARCTMPLITVCGHLGSRRTSSHPTLKYCW